MEMISILTLAVQSLTDFLTNKEATFLLGVKDDVEWIKCELIWMRSFLKDAEQKQGTNERIRQWVADIKSIANETQDIKDDFYKEFKGKVPSKIKLYYTTSSPDICKNIKALKEKLSDISCKREVYGIKDIDITKEIANVGSHDQLRLQQRRRTTSLTDEEYFVGFYADIIELEEKLLSNEQRRSEISIYGMGGLGKTSLARKLYNTNKDAFELHGWVCVSQEWNTRDLLEKIVKSLKKPTNNEELKFLKNLDVDGMESHLHTLLKDKRYLLVIDDMWDKEAWEECLRNFLPDDKNRSRVIITTRSKLVAGLSDERTYVHNLRRLREDESWELLCKNAFSNQNGARSRDLEEIGKEMVAKCDGLPLAIIVLGGLLSRKQSNDEWRVIKKRILRALIDKSIHISALLDLSYNDLTQELKSCFLYLSFFPEDYEIDIEKLVQLWIDEDLIPSTEGRNLEECAESYIKELNARSLIQLTNTNEYTSDSTYRVHDLVRDLAVKKAKELRVFPNYGESVNPDVTSFSPRRIAFRPGFEKYDMAIDDHSYSQALVVETEDEAEGSTSREPRDEQAYCDKPVMTREERAREAYSTMNADNKKENVLNHVDSLKKQFGDGVFTKCIVYNATGDTVKLVGKHNWYGNIGPAKYPLQIENGQWGGFLHVEKSLMTSGSVGAVVYRGKNLNNEDCDWMLSWSNQWHLLFQQDNCVYTEIREAGHFEQNHWDYIRGKLESIGKIHSDNWNGCSSSMTSGTGTTVVVEVIMTLENAKT